MGWHTKWGGYVIDKRKVRTFVVPENLHLFTLTPFVGEYIHAPKRSLKGKNGGIDGEVYLRLWKDNGGQD